MHTLMAALRALGTSIEDSGFDDAWVEAGIYGSTAKHQILEGNHMKRALTAHFITYSTLCDLHVDAFLRAEKDENGAEFFKSACCCLKNECILSGRQIQRARGKPQRVPKCNDHRGVSGEATKL